MKHVTLLAAPPSKLDCQAGLGRGGRTITSENPGIAKIGLTPPAPRPQSWHSGFGGFDNKSA